jgi:transcriptional regulator with XRE-family HTH domain
MSSPLLTPLTAIDSELADRLEKDDKFRRRYIRFFAQTEVATEIRGLRKRRRLRQAEVAKLAETGQSAISRIEKADYDGWTFKTLIAIAEGLRARLRITFEPIEDVVSGYRGHPSAEANDGFFVGNGTGTTTQTVETEPDDLDVRLWESPPVSPDILTTH